MKRILIGTAVVLLGLWFYSMATHEYGVGTVAGVKYHNFGLANREEMENPKIKYEISLTNAIVAGLLCETIVVPIYVVGWDLWVPVGLKSQDPNLKGVETTK